MGTPCVKRIMAATWHFGTRVLPEGSTLAPRNIPGSHRNGQANSPRIDCVSPLSGQHFPGDTGSRKGLKTRVGQLKRRGQRVRFTRERLSGCRRWLPASETAASVGLGQSRGTERDVWRGSGSVASVWPTPHQGTRILVVEIFAYVSAGRSSAAFNAMNIEYILWRVVWTLQYI